MASRKRLARILLYAPLTINEMSYSATPPRIIKMAECTFNGNKAQCVLYEDSGNSSLNITCEEEPKDFNLQPQQLPEINMSNEKTQFSMTNCLKLPDILSRPNIVYEATLHFKQSIPQSFFAHSNGIQKLSLFYLNSILPMKLFAPLNELRFLTVKFIADKHNTIVPADTLDELYNLETLIFDTNTQNLTKAHFRDLRKLKHLDLSMNAMQTIEPKLFSTLTQLTYLSLEFNELLELSTQMLAAQRNLLILDLSFNRLTHLPAGLFRHTPLLWCLRLNANHFSTPTSIIENISGLRYLYKLDLHYNRLKTLQGDVSVGYETLISSFAARVDSDSLVSLMPNLSSIFALDGEPNQSQSVNTKEINLRFNNFEHFDMAWLQQAQLACDFDIDLSDNGIRHINITTTTFNATKSCGTTIKLEYNLFECDCKLNWLANNNYLRNPFTLQCSVTQFENSLITQIHRSESCDWLPALCPAGCVCRLGEEALLINCEGATLTDLPNLPRPEPFARKLSMLSLSHTNFRQLPSNTTIGYANVTHLNASHNQLTVLRPIELPAKLLVLDVRHNRLEHLSAEFVSAYLNESGSLQQLYLAGNPWKCDCSAELLLHAVSTQRKRIADVGEMVCDNRPNMRISGITFSDICGASNMSIIVMGCLAALIIAVLFLFALYYKFRKQVHTWLYHHQVCLWCIKEEELDKDKTFDAFISYAHKDEDFVNQTLLPQLEQGEPPFRICTHERNWLAGAYIPEQIVESVSQSCRTIIILSQHFIESDWARMEFRTAHQCSLNEGRARIILVKYGEINCSALLDVELKAYLDANTYLDWADPAFWKKLRYAMPHRKGESRRAGMLELNKRVYVIGDVERNNWRREQDEDLATCIRRGE